MTTTNVAPRPDADLREAAVQQLRKKRGLQAHILAYVMVNLLLNAVWLLTMPGGFYWPIIPLLGWGIGLAFNIWDVYAPGPTDRQIEQEMRRLSRR